MVLQLEMNAIAKKDAVVSAKAEIRKKINDKFRKLKKNEEKNS